MKKYSILFFLVANSSLINAQIPSYVPMSNLIAWYPFSGNTIDSSGHGHDGTNNGAMLTADRFGNTNSAYYFDGTTSNISTSLLPPTGNAARTITCWFQYNALPASCNNGLVIAGYGATTSSCSQVAKNFSLEIDYTGSPAKARVDGVCVATDATQVTDTLTNGWHFFAALYDTSFGPDYNSIKIYVDGAFKTTSTVVFSSPITVNTGNFSNFLIGKGHYACARYFNGKIDDIGVWSRALTSCELFDVFRAGNNTIQITPYRDTVIIGSAAIFSTPVTGIGVTYQWQEDRGSGFVNLINTSPYSGVTTNDLNIYPTLFLMNNYKYRCIIISGGCYDTSSVSYIRVVTTGVNEMEQYRRIKIFPNPVINKVSIEADLLINKIEITNTIGQKILCEKYNSKRVIIDIASFAEGVYFIKINDLYTQKIVRQ